MYIKCDLFYFYKLNQYFIRNSDKMHAVYSYDIVLLIGTQDVYSHIGGPSKYYSVDQTLLIRPFTLL